MTKNQMLTRLATRDDCAAMVAMSEQKRCAYEKAQPQFWRRAEQANESQAKWFQELLAREDHILLVAETDGQLKGFVIGEIKNAPEVYDPGGLTIMVDDFCVADAALWPTVGAALLNHLKASAKAAAQVVVVCGHHDTGKRQFLQSAGLTIASEWFVGST